MFSKILSCFMRRIIQGYQSIKYDLEMMKLEQEEGNNVEKQAKQENADNSVNQSRADEPTFLFAVIDNSTSQQSLMSGHWASYNDFLKALEAMNKGFPDRMFFTYRGALGSTWLVEPAGSN